MAAYIPVPRDLTRVKTKVFFNLTKRQLICFGSAALIGVPIFFLVKGTGNGKAPAAEERPSVLEQLKEMSVFDTPHKPPRSHPERDME